jgi:alpha-1,4-digalacturonate transport system permease protein
MLKKIGKFILLHLWIIIGATIMFFPVFWLISLSLQPSNEIYSADLNILPKQMTFDNYLTGWVRSNFDQYFGNSLIIALGVAVLSVLINSMAGFALAKYNFRGKNAIFMIVLSAMILPIQVTMVPLYLLVVKLGWVNTFAGVIIPTVGQTFGVFLMRQYCLTIPEELLEAAKIDGCSDFRIYWQIILPLCKAAMAVNFIFQFMWRWNDLLWPLIVLRDQKLYTIQQALAFFRDDFTVSGGPIMAMSIVSMIPIVIIFFALQKYFIQGIARTGLK